MHGLWNDSVGAAHPGFPLKFRPFRAVFGGGSAPGALPQANEFYPYGA